ncbi:MAG: hypothetical protein WD845_01580 [Pirellulales bacterium]
MSKPSVLLLGSSDVGAGVDCESVANQLASVARVEHVADVAAAGTYLKGTSPDVELIVLCESRRGQYSSAAVDELRRLAPLARFWRVLGSWHEGEPRSGRPPAGCISSYWHQWPARAARELAAEAGEGNATWTLPVTATADERGLAEADLPIERHAGTIVVCANRFESAAALADACRLGGYDTRAIREGDEFHADRIVAMVWDANPECVTDVTRIAALRQSVGGAPLVAVVGFPRAVDVRSAQQAGVAAVVSKPYSVRDLLWHVERAVNAQP